MGAGYPHSSQLCPECSTPPNQWPQHPLPRLGQAIATVITHSRRGCFQAALASGVAAASSRCFQGRAGMEWSHQGAWLYQCQGRGYGHPQCQHQVGAPAWDDPVKGKIEMKKILGVLNASAAGRLDSMSIIKCHIMNDL